MGLSTAVLPKFLLQKVLCSTCEKIIGLSPFPSKIKIKANAEMNLSGPLDNF